MWSINSCKKNNFDENDDLNSTSHNHQHKLGETHGDILTSSSNIDTLSDNHLDIPTDGISVYNSMLYFETYSDFQAALTKIDQKSDSAIFKWLENFSGFNSNALYYLEKTNDEDVDDLELFQYRIKDPSLEFLLSYNSSTVSKIRIADTIYEIDMGVDSVRYLDLENNVFKRSDIGVCDICEGVACVCSRENERIQENENFRVDGVKSVNYFPFVSSVTMTAINYRKNNKGNWKRKKANYISVYLDQWHNLVYTVPMWQITVPQYITDQGATEKKSRTAKEVLLRLYGLPNAPRICVPEFGRSHNWTVDWDWDAHVDDWCD